MELYQDCPEDGEELDLAVQGLQEQEKVLAAFLDAQKPLRPLGMESSPQVTEGQLSAIPGAGTSDLCSWGSQLTSTQKRTRCCP